MRALCFADDYLEHAVFVKLGRTFDFLYTTVRFMQKSRRIVWRRRR